jgi:hypothetical protein
VENGGNFMSKGGNFHRGGSASGTRSIASGSKYIDNIRNTEFEKLKEFFAWAGKGGEEYDSMRQLQSKYKELNKFDSPNRCTKAVQYMGMVPDACPVVDGGIVTIWNRPTEADSDRMIHGGKLHTDGLWEVAFVSELTKNEKECRLFFPYR